MKRVLHRTLRLFVVACMAAVIPAWLPPAVAEGQNSPGSSGDADFAQELSNPIADLITLPIQMNYDRDIGPQDDGWKLQTNIVLPK
ncbi:MAG: hypothetical protein WBG37_10325 [Desulfobacterales bacterium]